MQSGFDVDWITITSLVGSLIIFLEEMYVYVSCSICENSITLLY